MDRATLDATRERLRENRLAMAKLRNESDKLTWQHVCTEASDPPRIEESLAAIGLYLKGHYTDIPDGFMDTLRGGLTMAPMTQTLYCIHEKMHKNTILYSTVGKGNV